MKLPNLLPKWIRGKSADPEGSTPVSNLAADPEGAAPKGLIFKIGVVLLAVLMAVVILLAPDDPGGNAQAPVAPSLPPPAGPEAVTKGEREIQDAEERRRLEESRAARAQQQAQQQAQRDSQERARQIQEEWQRQQEAQAGANAGVVGSAAGQQELTPEQQLQLNIRLEKIQRRHSSLRAAPVALSFRAAAPAAPAVPQVEVTPPPVRPQPLVRPQPSAPTAAAAGEPEPATARRAGARRERCDSRATPGAGPARLGADRRRAVARSGADHPDPRRFARTRHRAGLDSLLVARPPAHPDPSRSPLHRPRPGRQQLGPGPPHRHLRPPHLRRPRPAASLRRAVAGRRGRSQGSGQAPLPSPPSALPAPSAS